jgi:hypothetical protein
VREEGQPAQDDPGAEHAGEDREQQRLEQRALHERRVERLGQAQEGSEHERPLSPSTMARVLAAMDPR